MKTIDVKQQPQLSVKRTLEISLNGVRYRLFRSIVTVVVIAVAIAFMMNILCEAVSTRAVGDQARERTKEKRLAALWTTRLSVASTPEDLLREIAQEKDGSALLQEAREMGTFTDAEFAMLRTQAVTAMTYLDFFNDLDYGTRRQLVGAASSTEIFTRLQQPEMMDAFTKAMKPMRSLRLPNQHKGSDAAAEFSTFLATDWPALQTSTARLHTGREAAIALVQPALQGRSMIEALTEADGQFGQQIHDAGFKAFDAVTRDAVAKQARVSQDLRLLDESMGRKPVLTALAARLDMLQGDITSTLFWKKLGDAQFAAWYLETIKSDGATTNDLTPERLVALSRMKAEDQMLENALRLTVDTGSGMLGIGNRMAWLLLISMLVCIVGISNAMLMSVTERFREIATLKCLGALDTFIMMLFVMEAGMLGFVGGILGGLVGSLIGFGRMAFTFHSILFSAFPVGSWLLGLCIAIFTGVVLAALAGVYPSYIAARLAPMEAMRIE